jgi:hypothetical protein
MKAVILGLPNGEFDEEVALETDTSQNIPAIVVEETRYLDGVSIYHGTAAGRVKTSRSHVYVDSDNDRISTECEEIMREVATDFYADFNAGWVGVDTSDGDFLWQMLGPLAGAVIQRAELNLDRFAENYERRDDAECWQIGHSLDDSAGVAYHDEASIQTAPVHGLSQLGFEYWWDGQVVRGTVAASGYVAVYSNMSVEEFGRWIRDEILPYAALPEDDQQELTDTTDDVEECEECGKEDPDRGLHSVDGRELCIVCADAEEEESQTTIEDLDSVTVADGGHDD